MDCSAHGLPWSGTWLSYLLLRDPQLFALLLPIFAQNFPTAATFGRSVPAVLFDPIYDTSTLQALLRLNAPVTPFGGAVEWTPIAVAGVVNPVLLGPSAEGGPGTRFAAELGENGQAPPGNEERKKLVTGVLEELARNLRFPPPVLAREEVLALPVSEEEAALANSFCGWFGAGGSLINAGSIVIALARKSGSVEKVRSLLSGIAKLNDERALPARAAGAEIEEEN
jgi:hypothetical protein